MKCPSCNKFAALTLEDPEILSGPDVDDDGQVTAEIRIVRNSECCGDEMKESTFSLEGSVDEDDLCHCENRELDVEQTKLDPIEEGGSRYQKSYFGVDLEVLVTCNTCKNKWTLEMSDKVPASAMEEIA